MKFARFYDTLPNSDLTVIVTMIGIMGCGDNEDEIYKPQERNVPRVIAVDPPPGAQRTEAVDITYREVPTQKFRITFNEPIRPNSGCILFGSSRIQLQETEPTDTITFNQCFRRLQHGLAPGALVISDFANVNYHIQPHAFKAWYWMPQFDITGPTVL